jgi:hypothetical protein
METTVTEQTTPIPWRNLRLVRGGTKGGTDTGGDTAAPGTKGDTDTGGGTDTGGDTRATQGLVPVPVSGGDTGPLPAAASNTTIVPMTPAERAQLAARHWVTLAANGAGQLWLHPDRLGHSLYNGKPGSMAEHRAYIKSRGWVPPDLDGKAAKFIGGAGVVFYAITGVLQIPLLILYAALDRMLRTAGLIAAVLIFVFAILPHIHIHP